ncbi:conserved exported hypothetical protein [Candidatus Sulfopaludibacter sp. SbA3]|nr:conserved exported hypothetical protein [Candidatus Sulfopaludibacter sp. SbA3]
MFKGKTAKKLASLSAVGAGALVLTAGKAEAGIIYSVAPPNLTVGFGPSTVPSGGATLSGSPNASNFGFGFLALGYGIPRTSGSIRFSGFFRAIGASGSNNVTFAVRKLLCGCNGLRLFNAGVVWGSKVTSAKSLASATQRAQDFLVASRTWGTSFKTVSGASQFLGQFHKFTGGLSTVSGPGFTDKFALFTFNPNGTPLYGWLELSLSVSDQWGSDPALGPNLTLISFAYDTSGAQLPAGAPEPGTLSLAALALGAAGLRRWRASRKTKAA